MLGPQPTFSTGILSDHAAQNLRTTSIGLSIWLLLQSILVALRWGVHQCQPGS